MVGNVGGDGVVERRWVGFVWLVVVVVVLVVVAGDGGGVLVRQEKWRKKGG